MSRPEKDKLLEHEYDGIREYDNPLPGWWVFIFYACVIWAAGYGAWMHFGPGLAAREARFAALDARIVEKAASAAAPASLGNVEPGIRAALADPALLAAGSATFSRLCMPCHGPEGQGLIGPNMTDEYFIHGWTLPDLYRTISEGVPEKGMISWKTQLSRQEMEQVVAYVATLRGSHPPNAKEPQGDLATSNALTE